MFNWFWTIFSLGAPDSLRTLELSDCVLCIPFIRSGRPIECWLHTYQACAKATWRLGLRLFWSHAITIKIYLQIIFICCVSKTVRKIKVKLSPDHRNHRRSDACVMWEALGKFNFITVPPGKVLGLIFARYVPLAPHYSVANYRPHLNHF